MKRILILFSALILTSGLSFAQDELDEIPEVVIPGSSGRLMVDLFTDIWSNVPEGMDLNSINRGINISMMQDFRLGYSPFSVATGLGFASHNLYSDHFYEYITEWWSSAWPVPGSFDFRKIDDDFGDVKKNKLSLNYLNVPVEFRYRNTNLPKTFRIHAGLRLGYLVNAHTKTHVVNEDGIFGSLTQTEWKYKEHKLGNLEKFQVGITGKIGYGRLSLYGYLPLTDIFKDNYPAELGMKPLSVGISLLVY